MTYKMSKRMYREYTAVQKPGQKLLTHDELIDHINKTFGIRGKVEHLVIEG